MQRDQKGVTIRNPATANLYIDSTDRFGVGGQPANFSITRNNSILNGFFHRLAVAEVVVQWGVPNIITGFNDTFTIATPNAGGTQISITIPQGFYTMKTLLDAIVSGITAGGTTIPFVMTLIDVAGGKALSSTSDFVIIGTILSAQMNLAPTATAGTGVYYIPVTNPVVLPYTYIDFVCNDLTYNQSLKDATTNEIVRDVLYRWNFAWETPAAVDAYNYPVYQGYTPFIARRNITFPKQIKWESNMVLGNLAFQVFGYSPYVDGLYYIPLPPSQTQNGQFEWGMNMLVSEN